MVMVGLENHKGTSTPKTAESPNFQSLTIRKTKVVEPVSKVSLLGQICTALNLRRYLWYDWP